jgi:hypothetical protein
MAHFAKLDENNIVIEVNVINNDDIQNLPFPESELVGIEFLNNWAGQIFNWKQTSYNRNFRKNYAEIGFNYDSQLDAFIAPQPYPSWILNTNLCIWEAPVPYPEDGKNYIWNEQTQQWILQNPSPNATPVQTIP